MNQQSPPAKRRIFIQAPDRICQIFTFEQRPDGSIYCASPDFADANWVSYVTTPEGPRGVVAESIGEGKISVHGTGMVAVRPHNDPEGHQLIIKGNYLLDLSKKAAGARHLFTVFMREPKFVPENSPAFNRQSDYCLNSSVELKPFVMIFFAVPRKNITVDFKFSLHVDDMENVPNDVLGLHGFELRHHFVFWFAYRTKHMDRWPKESHFCYDNGYSMPVFVGTGPGAYRLEYRQPVYSLSDDRLEILCHQDYPGRD